MLDLNMIASWQHFSFFFISGLNKLPSVECDVFRGLDLRLTQMSHLYQKDGLVCRLFELSSDTVWNSQEPLFTPFFLGLLEFGHVYHHWQERNAQEIRHFRRWWWCNFRWNTGYTCQRHQPFEHGEVGEWTCVVPEYHVQSCSFLHIWALEGSSRFPHFLSLQSV